MKKHSLIKIGGAALLGLLLLSPATKAFAEGGTDRQLTLASDCQKRADTVNAQIAEQLELKAANVRAWASTKIHMPLNVAAKDKEYTQAIAALTAKRDQWLELAQWHKAEAMEEQAVASASGETAQN